MRRTSSTSVSVLLAICCLARAAHADPHLSAESFDSGFAHAHATFNGMLAASDGKIYYVLCSESVDAGAQMYSYDPATKRIQHLADLTEAAGEKGIHAIPQGKSHVNFVEWQGKLYFSTHVGYYTRVNGRETMGVPPPGYKPYPGGHFMVYDMASGKLQRLASAPAQQGIIDFSMDGKRGRLYGLTWPSGRFLRYDMASRELKDLGNTSKEGEAGTGPNYRILCRSLAVDPEDGSVYFTTADGDIKRYRYDHDAIETVSGADMRKDYFGSFNLDSKPSMGYNWRQTFWYEAEKVIYGLHGTSGYLFRFDPRASKVEVIERITSEPSRRSGMHDAFAYGYLSFALGPDARTVYYLTTGPTQGHTEAKARRSASNDVRLVTYNIPTAKYQDHGAVFLTDGQRPADIQSIAVAKDGSVYSLATFSRNGHLTADLIQIRVP
jgi:hypothetical protein